MRAYLELLRLPTVFTAMADIFLGFLLRHGSWDPVPQFVGLLIASCGLYLAGMVFNDYFDVAQDTQERPQRPIPSGRVSRRTALILGSALMAAGVVSAWLVAPQSRLISMLLVVAILAYDGVLKRTPLGPLGMGACRFLNVMLGASDFLWSESAAFWSAPQLPAAAGLGVYIVGVTWFARTEAHVSSRWGLAGGLIVMDIGLAVLVSLMQSLPGAGQLPLAMMLMTLIGVSINLRGVQAVADPSPERVQGLIKLFLLNYVTLAGTLVYWHTGNGAYTLATVCLILPALILSRLIAMT